MPSYRVVVPADGAGGIHIECEAHGTQEEFQPGYRKVAVYCSECGLEVGLHLEDTEDWRELGEMC